MKNILAEIVTIGDEILIGQIHDTNSTWISQQLNANGIRVIRKTSIADDEKAIVSMLDESLTRSDIVLITGGLGPTKDDITKKTLAQYFKMPLVLNEDAMVEVKSFYDKRKKEIPDTGYQQATLPQGATYIPNYWGTAPGMWFDHRDKVVVSMPGVPYEMKGMMNNTILPSLTKQFKTPEIIHKTIRTFGIGETDLSKLIIDFEEELPTDIKLAYLPSLGSVRLRLSAYGGVSKEQLSTYANTLKKKVEPYYYGEDDTTLEEACALILKSKKLSIATAESCTGGYVGHLITSIPGSSAYFKGGILSYANDVKINQLGVKSSTLEKHGAVSQETIEEMALGVCNVLKTDIGLATSGIAGPDGGTEAKPVGTIWVAMAYKGRVISKLLRLGNTRTNNIQLTALNTLFLFYKQLT